MFRRHRAAAFCAAVAMAAPIGLAEPTAAQIAVFPTAEPSRWARVEAGRPDVSDDVLDQGLSSAWFFTVHHPIPGSVVLVGELPLAYASMEAGQRGQDGSARPRVSAAVGNPYLGARLQFHRGPLTEFEVGIRLPLSSHDGEALDLGLLVDPVDRYEAFHPRTLPLTLRAVRSMAVGARTDIDLAAGTIWWLTSGTSAHGDQAAFYTYSVQARTGVGRIEIAAGTSGRYSALEPPVAALRGLTKQATVSLDYAHRRIRPGLFATVPLAGEANSGIAPTVGFRILVPLAD